MVFTARLAPHLSRLAEHRLGLGVVLQIIREQADDVHRGGSIDVRSSQKLFASFDRLLGALESFGALVLLRERGGEFLALVRLERGDLLVPLEREAGIGDAPIVVVKSLLLQCQDVLACLQGDRSPVRPSFVLRACGTPRADPPRFPPLFAASGGRAEPYSGRQACR